TIYSDEKEENQSGISVDEAAKLIGKLRGWGSSVGVYITTDGRADRTDLRKLFAPVFDNIHLELVYFGDEMPKVVGDHFLRRELLKTGTEVAVEKRERDRDARRAEAGPEETDPFQAALVAAVHHFAEDGELDHLRAVLDKYPKLVDAKQTFRQP